MNGLCVVDKYIECSFFHLILMYYQNYNNLPESSRSLSGLRFSTELLFDGIGKLGFGLFFNAAKACCTASCRTSVMMIV